MLFLSRSVLYFHTCAHAAGFPSNYITIMYVKENITYFLSESLLYVNRFKEDVNNIIDEDIDMDVLDLKQRGSSLPL